MLAAAVVTVASAAEYLARFGGVLSRHGRGGRRPSDDG
jgi:hypothetical protein